MALSTATITYDLANLVGVPHYQGTSVTATTNIPNGVVVDTDGNQVRLGSGKGTIAQDGTGEIVVWIPGVDSNPASWQTYIHIRYRDSAADKGHATRTLGPFTITASGDLADLIEEQAVPPEYVTALLAEMEALRDQQESLAGIDTTDTAVAYAMEFGATSPGYLSATYVSAVAALSTADGVANDRAAIAAADASAIAGGGTILLRPGVHRVATNLTVTSPVQMLPGATIKPDAGVTVTLAGGVEAPRRQVFDHSAGGVVAPRKVDFYHPAWWGPLGTADDSATWLAMIAALSAGGVTVNAVPMTQRVLAPTGLNRVTGLVFANCEIIADKGNVAFAPPVATTTGTMIRLNDYVTLRGGYFVTTEATQAVTLVDHRGYRTQLESLYVVPSAAGSVGVNLGEGFSITPVVKDLRIHGNNRLGKGMVVNSVDAELSNIWIAVCDVGIEWLRGESWGQTIHVWGCNTGMTGQPDGSTFVGLYLDSNRGWGADLTNVDRMMMSNINAWNNGAVTAGTGGLRILRSAASCAGNNIVNAIFDDNTGTGLLIDGADGTEIDNVRFYSRSRQGGGAALTTTGLHIAAASTNTRASIRGKSTDVLTAVVEDLSTSSSIEIMSVSRVLAADATWTTTTTSNALSIPVGVAEKWLIEGRLIVDGPQAADIRLRLQATASTGATGWFALQQAAAGSTASTSAVSLNPATVATVAASGGLYANAGLAGVGTKQIVAFSGYVTTGSVAGSIDLQASQLVADATASTIYAGSLMTAKRIA